MTPRQRHALDLWEATREERTTLERFLAWLGGSLPCGANLPMCRETLDRYLGIDRAALEEAREAVLLAQAAVTKALQEEIP